MSSSDALSTLDRVRSVALARFAARGYGGASMGDLAEGVGIRKASLYNYYDSKEALLLDLLERSILAWTAASRPPLEAAGPLEKRLYRHLEAALQFALREPNRVAIVRIASTQIGGALGERVGGILRPYEVEYRALIERQMEVAVQSGEFEGPPGALTRVWKSFLDGVLTNELLRTPDRPSYLEDLPELWSVFRRALVSPGAEHD